MTPDKGVITIRLSPDEARLVFQNVDGWMDAGACEGGLEPDEHAALAKLQDQILRGKRRLKHKGPTR